MVEIREGPGTVDWRWARQRLVRRHQLPECLPRSTTLLNVEMTRMDIQPLWEDIAYDVIRRSANGVHFTLRKVQADVLDNWPLNENVQYDIITISYLISEIAHADFTRFATQIRNHLAPWGALIINERPQESLQLSIDHVYATLGLHQYVMDHNKRQIEFRYPEEIRALIRPKTLMKSFTSVGINLPQRWP